MTDGSGALAGIHVRHGLLQVLCLQINKEDLQYSSHEMQETMPKIQS